MHWQNTPEAPQTATFRDFLMLAIFVTAATLLMLILLFAFLGAPEAGQNTADDGTPAPGLGMLAQPASRTAPGLTWQTGEPVLVPPSS